jgi:HK97 family phage major capsid protein
MTELTSGLENKAGAGIAPGDTEALVAQLMGAFEEFKRTNEQRLAQIERRGSADALTEEKVTRLNAALDGAKAALDRASLERARPHLEGGRPDAGDEYKEAFAAYVKRGEEKALSIGVNADGGYLVPTETDTEITRLMTALSPIRAIASVRQVSTAIY